MDITAVIAADVEVGRISRVQINDDFRYSSTDLSAEARAAVARRTVRMTYRSDKSEGTIQYLAALVATNERHGLLVPRLRGDDSGELGWVHAVKGWRYPDRDQRLSSSAKADDPVLREIDCQQ